MFTVNIAKDEMRTIESALLYKLSGLKQALPNETEPTRRNSYENEITRIQRILGDLAQILH